MTDTHIICYNTLADYIKKTKLNDIINVLTSRNCLILQLDKIDQVRPTDLSMSIGPNIHFKCVKIENNKVFYVIDYIKINDKNIYKIN